MHKIIFNKYLLFVIIVSIGGFLRFYKLSDYPVQLNIDEMSQLYEAISIAQTGKDIYGNRLPVVFPLFGVYAPGIYIYLTSLVYQILGDREIIIRIPAAVMGTFSIFSVYLFVNILFRNWKIATIAAFLIAIQPSEIFYSRKSFESMVGHFFVFLGFSFLLLYVRRKFQKLWAISGAFSLSFAMYTYAAHLTTIPILLLSYLVIFRKNLFEKRRFVLPVFAFILFSLPLLFFILTDANLRFRSNTIFISKDPALGSLIANIKGDDPLLNSFSSVKTTIDYTFNRYLNQFDPLYLFGNGLDLTNQGFMGMGPLYYFQFILVIAGFIFLIYLPNFSKEKKFFLSLIILSILPGSLTFEAHSPHRSVLAFALTGIVSGLGLYWIARTVKSYGRNTAKYALSILMLFIIAGNFIYFVHLYTINYPSEKSQNMHYPFKDVALFVWSNYGNFEQIVFDPQFGDVAPEIGAGAQYFFAYYGSVPPDKFQKGYHPGTKSREAIFDKLSIRAVYWPYDKEMKNTLIIASPWTVPENDIKDKGRIIKRFNFYNGQLAFYAIKL